MWQVLAGHERVQGQRALLDVYDHIAAQVRPPQIPTSLAAWEHEAGKLKSLLMQKLGVTPPFDWQPHWQVLGTTSFATHTVERVVIYSRPGFPVTTNLYIPHNRTAPMPAVFCPHGHGREGKAFPKYQALYISLARLGFVVLAPDCIGYGERQMQGHWRQEGPYLLGTSLAGLELWDNIKCIDFLATRSEVDAGRIGCMGNSGGGTQTMWCAALDGRVKAAVVSDATAPFWYNHAKERELCPCCMTAQLLADAEIHHVLGLVAPRPLLLLGGALDSMFPRDLQREVYRRLRRVYGLYGAEDQLQQVITPEPHSLSKAKREAACAFFLRHLAGSPEGTDYREPEDIEPLPADHPALVCFSERPPQLTQSLVAHLRAEYRDRFDTTLQGEREKQHKRERLRDLLHIPRIHIPQSTRRAASASWHGYQAESAVLWSDEATPLAVALVYPQREIAGIAIIADADGKDSAWAQERARAGVERGRLTLVADLRGWGELRSRELSPDGLTDERVAVQKGLGYDTPLMGLRVHDLLTVAHWARREWGQQQVEIEARGYAAPVALMAAAVDSAITGLALTELPATLLLPHLPNHTWPAFLAVPGLIAEVGDVAVLLQLVPPGSCRVESLMPRTQTAE